MKITPLPLELFRKFIRFGRVTRPLSSSTNIHTIHFHLDVLLPISSFTPFSFTVSFAVLWVSCPTGRLRMWTWDSFLSIFTFQMFSVLGKCAQMSSPHRMILLWQGSMVGCAKSASPYLTTCLLVIFSTLEVSLLEDLVGGQTWCWGRPQEGLKTQPWHT